MDDGERIHIPLDDPPAAVGATSVDERGIATTLEVDGTLRIALPTGEPCEPGPSGEIIVCASKPIDAVEPAQARPAPAGNPLQVRLGESVTIGPEVGPGGSALGGSGVEAKLTLRWKF